MRTDRYQRIDDALKDVLRAMARKDLVEQGLPTRAADQNLEGTLRHLRGEDIAFASIAYTIITLTGISVTHETIRAWWRDIEAGAMQ